MTNAQSIDGTSADICTLRLSTCPSQNDFANPAVNCAPTGTPDDSLCGFQGVADGYCRLFDANPDMYRYTTLCGASDDCKVGFSCDTLVTPQVCKF